MKKLLLLLIISIGAHASAVITTNVSRGINFDNSTNAVSMYDGVITAGEAGQSSGSFAIADQAAGFEIQTLTFSNNLPAVVSLTATNYPVMTSVANTNVLTRDATETDRLLTKVDKQGWANYSDTAYTIGSPLTVNNARVQLTVNGLGGATEDGYLPAQSTALWSTNSNYIISDNIGNAYDIRVQFTGDPVGITERIDLEFDIGGAGTNIITTRTISAPKGGDAADFSTTTALFSLGTFVTNGCKVYLNSTGDGSNWSIYDISIFVKQDYYD